MSVVKNKEKIDVDNLSVAEKFKSKLFEKQAVFFESVFPKYSLAEKVKYMEVKSTRENDFFSLFSIFIGLPILSAGCPINFHIGNFIYGFLCLFIGGLIVSLPASPFFKRINAKIWLYKEKNNEILRNEMFWNSSVDKETMRYLVQCYGKEMVKNIL